MRLIDADEIRIKPEYMHDICGSVMIRAEDVGRIINGIPSISHNSSESPNGWTLCSERLPNDNDYRECMECLDGAVWYFTENGAMGLGYYYESTKEWATIGELSTDGKVIAWMPLPEPFRAKENES